MTTRKRRPTVYDMIGRNPIHPFPARMAPEIAFEELQRDHGLRVLDPMMGSGTVLAVAKALGHSAIGIDSDPLAVLLSDVWTSSLDPAEVHSKAIEVLSRARRSFDAMCYAEAYPRGADEETKEFVRYWFDDYSRRQLAALSLAIGKVRDLAIRNALWCAFSRLIISKQAGASLAMDLSHSRPHRVYERAPTKPFNSFVSAAGWVTENCPQKGTPVGPRASVKLGDARALAIPSETVDVVITSPPYLNAIDYMRCSKFSLIWMGHTIPALRGIRSTNVGTEVTLPGDNTPDEVRRIIAGLRLQPRPNNRVRELLFRYADDMRKTVSEVARVLRRRGRAIYVVGNSTVQGTFIRNSSIVEAVAEASGLSVVRRKVRALPANRRYLPPPSHRDSGATLATRMGEEVVLTLCRN